MNDQLSQDETDNHSEVSRENVEPRRNDMLIMGTNMDVINQTKKMLHSLFDMKDMGEADVIPVEYYGIFLIGITYTRLMCGRIFGNQMAKFSKILVNKDMFTTEMNTTGLLNEGAHKILVAGLAPMGCLPIVITLFSENAIFDRGCIDFFSSVARSYNSLLQIQLNIMQVNHAKQGSQIVYLDTYSSLFDAVSSRKYGFKEVKRGCCGTGLLETTFLCNRKSSTCTDASKYTFWDSIHPTEQMYRIFFDSTKHVVDNMIKG
nr:GDSL esterase/lipase At5g45960 [Tanacetum cinerariifolium]